MDPRNAKSSLERILMVFNGAVLLNEKSYALQNVLRLTVADCFHCRVPLVELANFN